MANITGKPEDMANITGTGFREEFRKKKFGLTHDSPALFVSAQCFGQFVYLLWSGFSALFFFSMLMLDIYYSKDEGPEYLRFLTNLTYIFQNATLILDFINTIYVFFNRADIKNGKSSEMTWYLTIQWLMFNVTNTMSLTVSCLYFAALNPAFTHGSINTHLLNSVHTLTNIMICAKPVQILHVYQPMIYALIYLTFSVIYHLAGADPIYEPLDWSDTGITTGLGLLMILVLIPLIHIVFFSFYTFRVYVSQKCCKKSSRVEPEPEAVNQNVTTRNRSVATISDTISNSA